MQSSFYLNQFVYIPNLASTNEKQLDGVLEIRSITYIMNNFS